ncbi:MAG: ABC transporter permease subunit [Candidatus Dadabacteria bacterium]|nr:ABC transporter permease subunit [Candidatus Dadabacteria bacterium]NIS07614.1 ABC transporter permease subunit [Candidatus Dadabacteria bacterium]NIV42068.1 ABC transporter permease subunit [Candidatus Dadabacteria bacterium]NIX16473.1 ABC transporter permease subunit [Candidatus Dadabacteria bacterium]NIY21252.1 ABC transporter permease subunit [Candidatus Dadabacteria bacterium]
MEVLTESEEKLNQQAASKEIQIKKRRFADKIATVVVTSGGIAIILSIIAILLFIGIEVVPLWEKVKSSVTSNFDLKENKSIFVLPAASPSENTALALTPRPDIVAIGVEEFREIAYLITDNGYVHFIDLENGKNIQKVQLSSLTGKKITTASGAIGNKNYTLGTEDGYVVPVTVYFNITFDEKQKRILTPRIIEGEIVSVSESPIKYAVSKENEDGSGSTVAYTESGQLFLVTLEQTESFFGDSEVSEKRADLTNDLVGKKITSLALDDFLYNVYAGTSDGSLLNWDIKSNKENPKFEKVIDASESPITLLNFVLGNRSLIVGDKTGNVSTWFKTKDEKNKETLRKVHVLASHTAEVTSSASSPRDKGIITADSKGNIIVHHTTSEQKHLEIRGRGDYIKSIVMAPKANGMLAITKDNNLFNYSLSNEHPETNFKTLFGKVWYEGYQNPEYVWQSTGGTDEFEPKFSLTPLMFGTFKGAFYALLFAIPISILAAICVSQFMHPTLRNTIKPTIEIMAALPSVVLGFFAGLWMAPLMEKIIPALIAMPIIITIFTLTAVYVWQFVPKVIKGRIKEGYELFLLIPIIIVGILISLGINSSLESILFGGNYKEWLYTVLGLQYDQRNALVVGYAMGFAVIPIIFTISEDALSSVPQHLTAGSLALGANKWQTAIRVVLPTASAGIFSAVMIGLGRAVGETMIVLMATGNTPVLDWNIFNGFRTLSANIAVEIPEAPHGGTLYRILFLAALILFVATFLINTIAELVRQRLRKKYGQL